MTAFLAISQSVASNGTAATPTAGDRQSTAFAETLRQLERDADDMLGMQAVALTGASVVRDAALLPACATATDVPTLQSHGAAHIGIRGGWRDERCRVLAQDARPQHEAQLAPDFAVAATLGQVSEGSLDRPSIPADAVPATMRPDDRANGETADSQPAATVGHWLRDGFVKTLVEPPTSVSAPATVQAAAATVAARTATASAAVPPTLSSVPVTLMTAMTGAPQTAPFHIAAMSPRTAGLPEPAPAAAPPGFRAHTAAPPAAALVVAHMAADRVALAVRVAGLTETSERELLLRLRTELGAHGLHCYSLQLNGAGATPASPT